VDRSRIKGVQKGSSKPLTVTHLTRTEIDLLTSKSTDAVQEHTRDLSATAAIKGPGGLKTGDSGSVGRKGGNKEKKKTNNLIKGLKGGPVEEGKRIGGQLREGGSCKTTEITVTAVRFPSGRTKQGGGGRQKDFYVESRKKDFGAWSHD